MSVSRTLNGRAKSDTTSNRLRSGAAQTEGAAKLVTLSHNGGIVSLKCCLLMLYLTLYPDKSLHVLA